MPVQAKFITALCALHNFIRIHDPLDDMDLTQEELDLILDEDRPAAGVLQRGVSREETERATERRDLIASQMWQQYQEHAARRRTRRSAALHRNRRLLQASLGS